MTTEFKAGDRVSAVYAADIPARTGKIVAVHDEAYWFLEDETNTPMTVVKDGEFGRAMKLYIEPIRVGDIVSYYFDEYVVVTTVEYHDQEWLVLDDTDRPMMVSRSAVVEVKRK